jgi:ubiquitin C-terminal hydrolase
MRDWLLEELQPSSAIPHTTKDGSAYDAQLHSSMQSFWDLFDKGEYMQKITCTRCNTITSETKEAFSELVLQLPPSHQEGVHQTCTLEELIHLLNKTAELEDYQCTICKTRTTARSTRRISQYPKIMCIVLSRWGQNDTRNDLAVKYPLQGLFGSVHHNMNKGKSGHYIAICKSPDPDNWILYDDETVCREKFVTKGKNEEDAQKVYEVSFYSIL